MGAFTRYRAQWAAVVAIALSTAVHAEVESIGVDLEPLIRAASTQSARFAVEVSHPVSAATDGEWEESGNTSRWRYRARIPSALSISFHASHIALPPSASISVHANAAKADRRGELWSPIIPGDSLDIEIAVDTRERAALVFEIDRFQAGYRSLDRSVPDHPAYRRLRAQSATLQAVAAPTCVQNYACSITPDNTGPGSATVAISVRNALYCTATLVNDVPGDNQPYLLTARHCQTGDPAKGDSTAASGVTVYWNALTPCGQTINPFMRDVRSYQTGATTVVEQQDVWLMKLDSNPVIDNAYFAGLDATGSVVVNGYTVHHGNALSKQYVEWFGQAASRSDNGSLLHVPYSTMHWGTVNQLGSVAPGASGSALFDQNNRMTGTLSLASTAVDACPASAPAAPTVTTAVAFFTQLGQLWDNTSDSSSSTGSATLKSVLDPQNTGTLVIAGAPAKAFVRLYISPYDTIGVGAFPSWSAQGATSCVATGGRAGDGWMGPLMPGGPTPQINETSEGAVTYGITCTFNDGHTSSAHQTVQWQLPSPFAQLDYHISDVWVTRPIGLQWNSNVSPCALKGGSVDLSNLDAAASTNVTEAQPGTYTYLLTCGTGTRKAVASAQLTFTAPSLEFHAAGSDRRVGSLISLSWYTRAEQCTPSGGQPGDTWSSSLYSQSYGRSYSTVAKAPGVYKYTLTCTAGALSVTGDATATVENDPIYAQITASDNPIAVGEQVTLAWKSNADYCSQFPASGIGPLGYVNPPGHLPFSDVDDSLSYKPTQTGTITFTYRCFGGSNLPLVEKTLDLQVVSQPSTFMTVDKTDIRTGDAFTIHWNTQNTANSCTASGGGADGTQWTGAVAVPQGDKLMTASTTGTFTYALDCIGLLPRLTQRVELKIAVAQPVPPPPSGGSTGGGGGGGAFDGLTCLVLALCGFAGSRSRYRAGRAAIA